MNGLLSNTGKYAFPADHRGGEVRVKIRALDQRLYSLVVANNGIGLPPVFDMAKTQSLGLRPIYSLSRGQRKGTGKIITDSRTEVRINLPLRYKSRS